jgi:hypothetical protein
MNTPLLKSRRFWTLISDFVISLVLFFITRSASPEIQDMVKFIIAALQPVIAVIIVAFTIDDTVKAYLDHITDLYEKGLRK